MKKKEHYRILGERLDRQREEIFAEVIGPVITIMNEVCYKKPVIQRASPEHWVIKTFVSEEKMKLAFEKADRETLNLICSQLAVQLVKVVAEQVQGRGEAKRIITRG